MSSSSTILSWQTSLRVEYVEPFLPPPIIQSIRTLDDILYTSIGISEATINIVITLIVASLLLRFMQWSFSGSNNKQRRAIKETKADDEDDNQQKQHYDASILFTGPRNSGKTRLFYQFLQYRSPPSSSSSLHVQTVMSLQTNIDYVTIISKDETNESSDRPPHDDAQQQVLRLIDYPGHASVEDPTYIQYITPITTTARNGRKVSSSIPPPLRIVLVVDSTQPVTAAAELLFQLFSILHDTYRRNLNRSTNSSSIVQQPCIFVACHKKDVLKKAKNEKRIKIQIRTELERLIYHHSVFQTTTTTTTTNIENSSTDDKENSSGWWCCPSPSSSTTSLHNNNHNGSSSSSINPFTIAVDFDELPFVQVYFYPTTCCESTISHELFEFCTTGTVNQS